MNNIEIERFVRIVNKWHGLTLRIDDVDLYFQLAQVKAVKDYDNKDVLEIYSDGNFATSIYYSYIKSYQTGILYLK